MREVIVAGLFLAERYLPSHMAPDLVAAVDHDRAAARAASIRHVRTMYVPIDETCFSLFEAQSLAVIQEANDRFEFGYRRVSAVIELESSLGTKPT